MANAVPVAGNGLLERRAFLRGGAALVTGYVVGPAAAEPLAEAPWNAQTLPKVKMPNRDGFIPRFPDKM